MPWFPAELEPLMAVAAAAVAENGALIEANAGFLRLLELDRSHAIGARISGFFIQPDFAGLARMPSGADGEIHSGLLTVGDPAGRTQSLRARVWRVKNEMRLLAEYDVEELGRLYDIVLELNREYADAQFQLARTNVTLRQREAEIVALSLTDPLTGVGNRRRFEQALALVRSRAAPAGAELCALMADIDHFKRVNDVHGHEAGDKVLASFGELLRGATRAADVVARTGGEEFAVLMPNARLGDAVQLAERLRKAVAETRIEPLRDPVTVSVGVAQLAPDESAGDLLRRADEALYEAKRLGRNRVVAAKPRT